MLSEADIIKGCKEFDNTAQKALYKLYAGKMYSVCCQYVSDKDEAKDLLQDSFLKIYTNFGKYRADGPLGGWIRKIVVNTSISHLKKKKPYLFENLDRFEETDQSEATNTEKNQSHFSEHKEDDSSDNFNFTLSELLNAINILPEKLKLVFNLYAIEKYSHQEIADALQITIETSRARLMRARISLQKHLNQIAEKNTSAQKTFMSK
jgi:RNA polymerase sigma-70 factor (ECF subfamily)